MAEEGSSSTTHTNPAEPVRLDPQTLEAIIEGVASKLRGGEERREPAEKEGDASTSSGRLAPVCPLSLVPSPPSKAGVICNFSSGEG